ncbi:hypothetical protein LCGC14_1507520, partial [marine sediment metagenome]
MLRIGIGHYIIVLLHHEVHYA